MQEKPSEYDEQVHPAGGEPIHDPATGGDEPAKEEDVELGVPPAFDPAVKSRSTRRRPA